jgi:hypothetical protein
MALSSWNVKLMKLLKYLTLSILLTVSNFGAELVQHQFTLGAWNDVSLNKYVQTYLKSVDPKETYFLLGKIDTFPNAMTYSDTTGILLLTLCELDVPSGNWYYENTSATLVHAYVLKSGNIGWLYYYSDLSPFNTNTVHEWSVPTNKDLSYFAAFGKLPRPTYVEMSSFSASFNVVGGVKLTWTTSLELNSLGFYVERNSDNEGWNRISTLIPAQRLEEYEFSDVLAPIKKYIEYRLLEVDISGKISTVATVEITDTSFIQSTIKFTNDIILNIQGEPNAIVWIYSSDTFSEWKLEVGVLLDNTGKGGIVFPTNTPDLFRFFIVRAIRHN